MTALRTFLPDATIINLQPQQRHVYDYLMTGRQLTRQVAINTLNIQEVTTRISQLRKLGLDIKTAWKQDFRETRYKAYWVEINQAAA